MQLFLFLFPLQHMKRPALHNKQVGVLRMAFRARKVFGTFVKRAPVHALMFETKSNYIQDSFLHTSICYFSFLKAAKD